MESGVFNPITMSIRVALGLVIIIVLIYATFLILKKIRQTEIKTYKKPIMEIISTINLGIGSSKALHMVRAGEKVFMIGVTASSITLLAEIDIDLKALLDKKETYLAQSGKERRFEELLSEYTERFVGSSQLYERPENKKDEM